MCPVPLAVVLSPLPVANTVLSARCSAASTQSAALTAVRVSVTHLSALFLLNVCVQDPASTGGEYNRLPENLVVWVGWWAFSVCFKPSCYIVLLCAPV